MSARPSISDALLSRSVIGVDPCPGTLADPLGRGLTLLLFLRHFGRMFCRETLADMRSASERDSRFPEPLFSIQDSPIEDGAFLRRYWHELRANADPTAEVHRGCGVRRGAPVATLGPAVWSAKPRANAKGHRNRRISGGIWGMPGVFLAHSNRILRSHAYRNVADHPDDQQFREVAASAASEVAA